MQRELVNILYPQWDWTEEDGTVLWWHLPIKEPPYVGSHSCMGEKDSGGSWTDCRSLQVQGFLTHWSRIPVIEYIKSDAAILQFKNEEPFIELPSSPHQEEI